MTVRVCGAAYRSATQGLQRCTKPYGHESNSDHSWQWLFQQDRIDRDANRDIEVLLENINNGDCDPYLDALLAALHGRKRYLRGVAHPYGTVRTRGE